MALDVSSLVEAEAFVKKLQGVVALFKIGLQLFTREGPAVVAMVRRHGAEVFLDLKFHDIPNTVARACESAAQLGVSFLTLHTSGGKEMMAAAVRSKQPKPRGKLPSGNLPKLLGVTVLTSEAADSKTSERVVSLARLAQEAGLDGVVCSGHEIAAVRRACGKDLLLVVPGIRPVGSMVGDQKRVMTPREALDAGADYLVMGRPILEAKDPRQAVHQALQ